MNVHKMQIQHFIALLQKEIEKGNGSYTLSVVIDGHNRRLPLKELRMLDATKEMVLIGQQ